ncbi:hypothetical protein ACA910_006075 [Epithemia clementina (nom. ined.)]
MILQSWQYPAPRNVGGRRKFLLSCLCIFGLVLLLNAGCCQGLVVGPATRRTNTDLALRSRFLARVEDSFPCHSFHYRTDSPFGGSSLSHGNNRRRSPLQGKNDDYDDYLDDERYQKAWMHNQLRTDVRIFLTQRALQSFIYLLLSCRDPHTVKWLENMYDFGNLESYHGTGALNLTRFDTWDALLLDLVQRPKAIVVVAARRRGRGHGGWSSNNPHFEESQQFVEFDIDIDPASLVSRMVSVRQQIAQEWVADLSTLVAVNDLILESYHATQNQERSKESRNHNTDNPKQDSDANNDINFAATDPSRSQIEDDGGSNIEDLTGPYSAADNDSSSSSHPFQRPRRGRQAYESMANVYLNNNMMEHESRTGLPSSPQRKGNFDLLSLLATQEAVHVVLRQYLRQGEQRQVSLEWLRQFYQDRLSSHFDGDGPYGRSDDFLQNLLLAPPTATTKTQQLELVDPLRIAEDIIQARSQVALEWKDIMQHVVPSDHMQLQKAILAVRMNGPSSLVSSSSEQQEQGSTTTTNPLAIRNIGEFE